MSKTRNKIDQMSTAGTQHLGNLAVVWRFTFLLTC